MQQASSVDHRGGARNVQGILEMHHNTDGGKERTSSGYVVRRPKMTVYCTAAPTPEQRGGGALFPDAPAPLMKGMPYALTAHPTGRGFPCVWLGWLGRGPNVWGRLAVHTVL